MSTYRKPRADSPLKTLPADRQAAIAEYAAGKSLDETVAWLNADGLRTSRTALSLFLSWYALRQQMVRNESTVETLLQKLQSARPDWTAEQLEQAGNSFFSALAIEQQDSLTWKRIQDAKLKQGLLKLNQQKFVVESDAYFERLLEKAKELLANTGLSQAERIAAMRQAAFKDVEELEQSGKLVIPK